MAEKPVAAFVLSLLGGIFYILGGLLVSLIGAIIGGVVGLLGGAALGIGIFAFSTIGLFCGIGMIVGAVLQFSSNIWRVKVGSVLVLVLAIVGAIFTFLGLIVGFVLAVVGSLLGLVWWKPSSFARRTPVPPS